MDEHLCLRPFPQGITDVAELKANWEKYREEIMDENGIAIFMFGNKKDKSGAKVKADGCIREFEIAKDKDCVIIPLGCTGDAATDIYNSVKDEMKKDDMAYLYLRKNIDELGAETDIDKLVNIVMSIVKEQRKVN